MTTTRSISLLGPPEIRIGQAAVTEWPSRAAEAVIAYVAMAGRPVARTVLIDLLWPESEPKQARANLRTILTHIRRLAADLLAVDRKTITLTANVFVDVLDFDGLSGEDASIEQLTHAVALYRGPFLAGFELRGGYPFEEWLVVERERWEHRYARALSRLVAHHLQTGAYQIGEPLARDWVALDPYNEQATQQLMWLQLRQGQRTAALQSYNRLVAVLREELGVEPLGATQAIWERARRAGAIGVNNLPPERTPLIGRKPELSAIIHRISRPEARLVTLFGMGGIGKTRLALAVGRAVVAEKRGMFLDGVWFVSLAASATADEMHNQIVTALNVPVRGNRPIRDQLLAYLQPRELLLILDNVEQLVSDDDAVDWITNLLGDAPGVTLLLTSRTQLDLYEEQIVAVGGLPTDSGDDASAAALFAQHAARRHVALAPEDRPSVLAICRWLDGVPLGIELAASWLDRRSPADIHAILRTDRDLLQTRYRNVPARQRSLRAVFDYSWALLSADEQRVFSRLCIFPETFDARAAAAVTDADAALLRALVGKSLVQVVSAERYVIHSLLREYGLEQVKNRQSVNAAHATYFLEWLVGEYPHLLETGEDRVAPEVPNLRRAWVVGATDDLVAAAIPPLGYYWRLRGWYAECVALLTNAVESAHPRIRLRALNEAGHAHIRAGDYDASAPLFEQARALTEGIVSAERANALQGSGLLAMRRKALPQAIAYLEEAADVLRQMGDDARLARVLGQLTQALSFHGTPNHALFAEALALPTFPLIRAQLLEQAGRQQIAAGRYQEAIATFDECVRLHTQLNFTSGAASAQLNQGIALTYDRQWEAAAAILARAQRWFEANDEMFGIGLIYLHQGMGAAECGDLKAAEWAFRAALRVFETMGSPFGVALVSAYLAGNLAEQGQAHALKEISTALARLQEANSPALFATHLMPLALGLAHLGYVEEAVLLCGYALPLDFTEAFGRKALQELCDRLREDGVAIDTWLVEGVSLSAEALVQRVRQLNGGSVQR